MWIWEQVSGAYFYMAVSPQGGILVQNTVGPPAASQNLHPGNFPDGELPHMRALSDMMWAMWEYFVPAAQRSGLKFVMSLGINNPTSVRIIRRALDSVGKQLTTTPHRFEPWSEGGLAILGTLWFDLLARWVRMWCADNEGACRIAEWRMRGTLPDAAQEPDRAEDCDGRVGV
tara:strand:- start:16862 stop:17380 length:519 start_codon:yes stop_codon:yes gene_type:complete